MMFSQEVVELLRIAGWFPGRRVDVSEMRSVLQREGFNVSPAAEAVLSEFGGLTVKHPHSRGPNSDLRDYFHFQVSEVMSGSPTGWVFDYSEMVGESLCPIGQAFRGYMIMCVGSSGHVYGGYDNTLVLIGNTAEEAIGNMCTGVRPIDLSYSSEHMH